MVYIGSDHAGFALKVEISGWLREWGVQFEDLGARALNPSDDYPDFAFAVAESVAVSPREHRGVLACGSGQGVCIAANKVRGVHAVVLDEAEQARLSREHGDTNVLCLSAWRSTPEQLKATLRTWLDAPFPGEERHRRRLQKISDYETAHWKE